MPTLDDDYAYEERAGILEWTAGCGYTREQSEQIAREQHPIPGTLMDEAPKRATDIDVGTTTLTKLEMDTLTLIRNSDGLVIAEHGAEIKKAVNRLIRKGLVCFRANGVLIEKRVA